MNLGASISAVLITLGIVLGLVGSITGVEQPKTDGDWIASVVESGKDNYGNCYLYVRPWQWIERVPCDRIGKGG